MSTSCESIEAALAHHQAGRLDEAEAAYRQWLASQPRHAQALYLLGVVMQQRGRVDDALGFLKQAVAIDPTMAVYHNGLGEAYRASGQLDLARQAFETAVSLRGDFAVMHFNLATMQQALGQFETAYASYHSAMLLDGETAEIHNTLGNVCRQRQLDPQARVHYERAIALRPGLYEAHNNLGNLLLDAGLLPAAIAAYEQALAQQAHPQVFYNLGNALRAAKRVPEALAAFRRAIELAPANAQAHNNLGALLHSQSDNLAAETALAEAVRLNPRFVEALSNLGVVRQDLENLPGAADCFRQVIALEPQHVSAHYNLGTVLQAEHDWDQAVEFYQRALELHPYAKPHCNLGIICLARGRLADARAHFDRAIALEPDCAEAHYNRGVLLLSEGNYREGWQEFAWEFRCDAYRGPKFESPWDGSPLEGRTLLVYCDHGLGDTLQFIRYAPWARAQGAGRVVLAVQNPLVPLLSEQQDLGEVISADAARDQAHWPTCDVHVPLLMLPGLAKSTPQTIPNRIPYLRANEQLVRHWADHLQDIAGFKVGICWQGNKKFAWDHLRSVPLETFAPLSRVMGARLISLQKGAGREQLAVHGQKLGIVDLGEAVDRDAGAFRDTAAILMNLDLVITTDSAVAHLAGALGRPVWLALSTSPEWRWGFQGTATPWYPHTRLFRQTKAGDWQGLFERIAFELRKVVDHHEAGAR